MFMKVTNPEELEVLIERVKESQKKYATFTQKQAAFAQYKYPEAKKRYAEIADYLKLSGTTDDDKVQKLIEAIEKLKADIKIPDSLKNAGVDLSEFYAKLDLMSEMAFDDQCTGANPRYPLIAEIKQLYINAFNGELKEV